MKTGTATSATRDARNTAQATKGAPAMITQFSGASLAVISVNCQGLSPNKNMICTGIERAMPTNKAASMISSLGRFFMGLILCVKWFRKMVAVAENQVHVSPSFFQTGRRHPAGAVAQERRVHARVARVVACEHQLRA